MIRRPLRHTSQVHEHPGTHEQFASALAEAAVQHLASSTHGEAGSEPPARVSALCVRGCVQLIAWVWGSRGDGAGGASRHSPALPAVAEEPKGVEEGGEGSDEKWKAEGLAAFSHESAPGSCSSDWHGTEDLHCSPTRFSTDSSFGTGHLRGEAYALPHVHAATLALTAAATPAAANAHASDVSAAAASLSAPTSSITLLSTLPSCLDSHEAVRSATELVVEVQLGAAAGADCTSVRALVLDHSGAVHVDATHDLHAADAGHVHTFR